MTTEQLKAAFNQAIAKVADADARARMEVAREFFTNPDFRKKLEAFAWQNRK